MKTDYEHKIIGALKDKYPLAEIKNNSTDTIFQCKVSGLSPEPLYVSLKKGVMDTSEDTTLKIVQAIDKWV